MKNIKKFTAILLALTILLFSFSLSGFAADEEIYTAEELIFSGVKIFDGKLALYYINECPEWGFAYEIELAEGGTKILSVSADDYDYRITDEKVIFSVDNSLFAENTEYRLTVTHESKNISELIFNSTDSLAVSPEFCEESYWFMEYSETDMTDEILLPVGYEKELFLNGFDIENYDSREYAVDVDGMTITANKTGNGYLRLYDGERNQVDEAWTQISEYQPSSFIDAFGLSFRKYFESAEKSAENFLLAGMWTAEGIYVAVSLPFIIIGRLIEYPFRMMFGEI